MGQNRGAASVMGLINDEDDYVQLIVDKEVADEEWFGCNTGNRYKSSETKDSRFAE